MKRFIDWCHANTDHNHAFVLEDGERLHKGMQSLCGAVVHPGEIKTYGCMVKCFQCYERIHRNDRHAGYLV